MRLPFARLARPDAARPSLRERAAALKASAARVNHHASQVVWLRGSSSDTEQDLSR